MRGTRLPLEGRKRSTVTGDRHLLGTQGISHGIEDFRAHKCNACKGANLVAGGSHCPGESFVLVCSLPEQPDCLARTLSSRPELLDAFDIGPDTVFQFGPTGPPK